MNLVVVPRWWILAFRGVVAVVFAVLAELGPAGGLAWLVLLFAAMSVLDGAANLLLASARVRPRFESYSLAVEGATGVVVGVLAALQPTMSSATLLALVIAWAFIRGLAAVAAAAVVAEHSGHEWRLLPHAIWSLGFAALLLQFPGPGALAAALWLAGYAMISGATLVFLALDARTADAGLQPALLVRLPAWMTLKKLLTWRATLARWSLGRRLGA